MLEAVDWSDMFLAQLKNHCDSSVAIALCHFLIVSCSSK